MARYRRSNEAFHALNWRGLIFDQSSKALLHTGIPSACRVVVLGPLIPIHRIPDFPLVHFVSAIYGYGLFQFSVIEYVERRLALLKPSTASIKDGRLSCGREVAPLSDREEGSASPRVSPA